MNYSEVLIPIAGIIICGSIIFYFANNEAEEALAVFMSVLFAVLFSYGFIRCLTTFS